MQDEITVSGTDLAPAGEVTASAADLQPAAAKPAPSTSSLSTWLPDVSSTVQAVKGLARDFVERMTRPALGFGQPGAGEMVTKPLADLAAQAEEQLGSPARNVPGGGWLLDALEGGTREAGRLAGGALDFATSPAGALSTMLGAAYPAAAPAMRAAFATSMAPQAIEAAKKAYQDPTGENVGSAIVSGLGAAAPIAPEIAGAAKGMIEVPARALDEHNARAEQLVEQERNRGLQVEGARKALGADSMPVQVGDSTYTVEAVSGSGSTARPAYLVRNAEGKPVFAGYGENTQGYLRMIGARPLDEAAPKEAAYEESQPTGPIPQPPPEVRISARAKAAKPEIPETGPSDVVQRVQDARENLAQQLAGKPFRDLTNPERLVVDHFVTEGYGFSAAPAQAAQKENQNGDIYHANAAQPGRQAGQEQETGAAAVAPGRPAGGARPGQPIGGSPNGTVPRRAEGTTAPGAASNGNAHGAAPVAPATPLSGSEGGVAAARIAPAYGSPIPVREMAQPKISSEAQPAVADLNNTSPAHTTPAEQAVKDGQRLTPSTVTELAARIQHAGEHATLAQAISGENGADVLQHLVKDGVLTPQEANGYVDERGHLTPEAKDRVSEALVGRLYETPQQFASAPPEMRAKLDRVVPQVLRTEGRAGWDIGPVVREANAALDYAQAHNIRNLDDLTKQQTLEGEQQRYSPEAIAVAKKLQESPTRAEAAFRQYANDEAMSRPGAQTPLFEPPSQREAFAGAFGSGAPSMPEEAVSKGHAEQTKRAAAGLQERAREGERESLAVPPGTHDHAGSVDSGAARTTDRGVQAGPRAGAARGAREDRGIEERLGPEHGGVPASALTLGLDRFVKDDVAPAARGAVANVAEALRDAVHIVAPLVGKGHDTEQAALILRHRNAELARRTDQARERARKAIQYFEGRPARANYDFIANVEAGKPQGDPVLDGIARVIREMFDQRRNEIQDLGTGKLRDYYENYFGRIWKDPRRAQSVFRSIFARRPLEGSKGFLKQRKYATFEDGLNAGLEPVTDNPMEMALLKTFEMDKYILAHRVLNEWKAEGLAKFVPALGGHGAPGWRQIADPIGTVYGNPEQNTSAGGLVVRGHWYAPEGAAAILENHLSPGLRKYAAYRMAMGANNWLNAAQLGLTARHIMFDGIDAWTSSVALGIRAMLHGMPWRGAKQIVKSPAAPFTAYVTGNKVLSEWLKPGSQGGPIAAIADHLTRAGGRAHMDSFYRTRVVDNMMRAVKRGNVLGVAFRLPFAALEAAARPVMEVIVPRMKMGVFAELAQFEIERLGPNATAEDVRLAMAQAWDSVENRMGELTYDNLFWHRMTKDLAMLVTRSVGWNVGVFREGLGAVADLVKTAKRLATGKPLDGINTNRMAYVVATVITTAVINALYQKLKTGHGPSELKDYFFARNGAVDDRGHEERISPPTYTRDVWEWTHDPVQTAENKIAPVWTAVAEMIRNEDFYHNRIRNEDDPLVQQLIEEAEHVARTPEPISVRDFERAKQEGASIEGQAEQFFGFKRAPQSVERTAAERLADELARQEIPAGGRTAQEAARRDAEHEITRLARTGKDWREAARAAIAAGTVTAADVRAALKRAELRPLAAQVRGLSIENALKVWKAATPEERRMLRPEMVKKYKGLRRQAPELERALAPKMFAALASQ
jgi:polyhydroxyalkanoate synthesis regulator phasin